MRIEPVPVITFGQVTVSSSVITSMPAAAPLPTMQLFLKALVGNVGIIYVGDTDVSSSVGYPLEAGQEIILNINSYAHLRFLAASNGDKVGFIVE